MFDTYVTGLNDALVRQPRLWEPDAVWIPNVRHVQFPRIGAVRAEDIPPKQDEYTRCKIVEMRPKKYCLAFDPEHLPGLEELAKFLDDLTWRLCTGGPINEWTNPNPELTLPDYDDSTVVNKLYVRMFWEAKKFNDPWREVDQLHISGRFGTIPLKDLGY